MSLWIVNQLDNGCATLETKIALRTMAAKKDPKTGKFIQTAEKNAEKIWLRVPERIYLEMIDLSDGDIPSYARQAILEKVERDKQKAC